jgi:broad specificity phosphatase PhoE
VSDIPLTANGERVIEEAGPRIVGEGDDSGLAELCR